MTKKTPQYRLKRLGSPSLKGELATKHASGETLKKNAAVNCGWGRLIFGHTFTNPVRLAKELQNESEGRRDIAFYVPEPQVLLALAPQELFLDPSYTYRLWFDKFNLSTTPPRGFTVRLARPNDFAAIKTIAAKNKMTPFSKIFFTRLNYKKSYHLFVAESEKGEVLGFVLGVDHVIAFRDPEQGSSLWNLTVDPNAKPTGVGLALVIHVINFFRMRSRNFLDLSVLHDNKPAIQLYEKIGFARLPIFTVKRKSAVNEKLFMPVSTMCKKLNPYAKIISDEAMRRGISVEVLPEKENMLRLSLGSRSVVCHESLTEFTTAIAAERCSDKILTRRILQNAKLPTPTQIIAESENSNNNFLKKFKTVVVKPVHGEQGIGVTAGVQTRKDLHTAIKKAQRASSDVILEEFINGEELRVVLINYHIVAAALRKPPVIIGDGRQTVQQLIHRLSRRLASATGGESQIPIDTETKMVIGSAGYQLNSIVQRGELLQVRNTANLHQGGKLQDITKTLSVEIKKIARRAAHVLDIPVVGFDLIVPPKHPEKAVIIEANERPGLANHEPQPVAERFIDFIFPQTHREET